MPNLASKVDSERKAFLKIFSLIDNNEYLKLFDEYEQNETKEARFVKQIDKFEMALQAYEYEKQQKIDLQEFFDDARSRIYDKRLQQILKKIIAIREKNA